MPKIASLVGKVPAIAQPRMTHSGYCLWLCWTGRLSSAVANTLADHGGMVMAEENSQALWFFFSEEGVRALARLQNWAKLNAMPVFCQLAPATLGIGYKLEVGLNVPSALHGQECRTPEQFEAWIHPKVRDKVLSIPGLSLKNAPSYTGTVGVDWELLHADSKLNYPTSLTWYVVVRPVGSPSDKAVIEGWRAYVRELEPILEKQGAKYILNESNLIFPLDTVRQLKQFCRDIQLHAKALKQDPKAKGFWPCVIVCAPRAGLSFTEELPKKLGVDFRQLTPDFPHLSYRNAFVLGREFRINDIRLSYDRNSVEDWCYVTLAEGASDKESAKLQSPLSKHLVAGQGRNCFYCGLKNHGPAECPSRQLVEWTPEIWDRVAVMGVEALGKSFQAMDAALADNPVKGLNRLLEPGEGAERVTVQAIFDLNAAAQHRVLRLVWRSRGQELPQGLRQLAPMEGEFVWQALDAMRSDNIPGAEKLLAQAKAKDARHYQANSLLGFLALEQGDPIKAQFYWKEAERACMSMLQQTWLQYLQGRLLEAQEEHGKAMAVYRQVAQAAPRWLDPVYRQAVCLVKTGFSDQALAVFHDLIRGDPHVFNRLLLDPELERGRVHILSGLHELWTAVLAEREKHAERLEKLTKDVTAWFDETDEFAKDGLERCERLEKLQSVENYVAFHKLAEGVVRLQYDLTKRVDAEVKILQEKTEKHYEELREIYKEASWFPFPKLLREFNHDFNESARKLRFIRLQSMRVAENFRKAKTYVVEVAQSVVVLRGRLVSLRIIRDSTLFGLMMGRNFLWIEMVMLGISLAFIPVMLYMAQRMDSWWTKAILEQKWQVQKGVIIILSVVAIALAALKTAVQFEKRKEKLFEAGEAEGPQGENV